MEYLMVYLLLINAAGFLIMRSDKRRAVKKSWRIPERTLMAISVLGGSAGVFLAMAVLRHKTKHSKFSIGVPLILTVQALLLLFLWMQK